MHMTTSTRQVGGSHCDISGRIVLAKRACTADLVCEPVSKGHTKILFNLGASITSDRSACHLSCLHERRKQREMKLLNLTNKVHD